MATKSKFKIWSGDAWVEYGFGGNVDLSNYLTKSAAASTYLGISAKAVSAYDADWAEEAGSVAWGNVSGKPSSYYTLPTASSSILGGVKLQTGDMKGTTNTNGIAAGLGHTHSNYLTSHQSLAGYAKESWVNTQIANLVNSAPETLDTLGELATALENHKDAYDALLTTVGGKLDKSGGTITGVSAIDTTSNTSMSTPALNILHTGPADSDDYADLMILSGFKNGPYGFRFKTHGSGTAIIQSQRINNDGEVFPLSLNPNGGNVLMNGKLIATQEWVKNKGYLTSLPTATSSTLGGVKIVDEDLYGKTGGNGYAAGVDHSHSNYAVVEHSSLNGTYGLGSTSLYGHVKLQTGDMKGTTNTNGIAAGLGHTHSNYLTSHQSLAGYAKESWVNTQIANLVNSAPETLDTLGELATALENHKDAYDSLLEVVGKKAEKNDVYTKTEIDNKGFITSLPTDPEFKTIYVENKDNNPYRPYYAKITEDGLEAHRFDNGKEYEKALYCSDGLRYEKYNEDGSLKWSAEGITFGLPYSPDSDNIYVGDYNNELFFQSNSKRPKAGYRESIDGTEHYHSNELALMSDLQLKADKNDVYTKTEIDNKGFVTSADIPKIPTKVSELENDSGYINKITNFKLSSPIRETEVMTGKIVLRQIDSNIGLDYDAYTISKRRYADDGSYTSTPVIAVGQQNERESITFGGTQNDMWLMSNARPVVLFDDKKHQLATLDDIGSSGGSALDENGNLDFGNYYKGIMFSIYDDQNPAIYLDDDHSLKITPSTKFNNGIFSIDDDEGCETEINPYFIENRHGNNIVDMNAEEGVFSIYNTSENFFTNYGNGYISYSNNDKYFDFNLPNKSGTLATLEDIGKLKLELVAQNNGEYDNGAKSISLNNPLEPNQFYQVNLIHNSTGEEFTTFMITSDLKQQGDNVFIILGTAPLIGFNNDNEDYIMCRINYTYEHNITIDTNEKVIVYNSLQLNNMSGSDEDITLNEYDEVYIYKVF